MVPSYHFAPFWNIQTSDGVFPVGMHVKPHVTQLKQLTQTQTHLLYHFNVHSDPPNNMKVSIFHNNDQQ